MASCQSACPASTHDDSDSNHNTDKLVYIAVGSAAGLVVLTAVSVVLCRRSRRRRLRRERNGAVPYQPMDAAPPAPIAAAAASVAAAPSAPAERVYMAPPAAGGRSQRGRRGADFDPEAAASAPPMEPQAVMGVALPASANAAYAPPPPPLYDPFSASVAPSAPSGLYPDLGAPPPPGAGAGAGAAAGNRSDDE